MSTTRSTGSGDREPTQSIAPGADPTQEPDDSKQGNAALVDPAAAAQAEFEPDDGAPSVPDR